ncbi:hypothetical protein N7523_004881 [Penicillium sp. IBT 18751x]|nr:hypothetical protein N7523_004881 [Penicillium sp. IBT 18751x]
MVSWNDMNGPPRKRMRKGTKSCTQCRRRKIRCTFNPDRPEACNECRLRGSTCIDQEYDSEKTSISGAAQGDQRYSLRERVAHLENVVQDLAKRIDKTSPARSPARRPSAEDMRPPTDESDKLGPSSCQIQSAPVMQLFDNYLVSRREDLSINDQFMGAKDASPKARTVRTELLSLLPCAEDIRKIIQEGSRMWCKWEENFPELVNAFEAKSQSENLVAPAEIAKGLVYLSISVLQSPPDFDFNTLRVPINPQEFAARCCAAADRLIVRDDDYAATLPGMECQMLLSKYHLNEGRLRKAWLVVRRTIEFAHLAGMHLSTRTPRPTDTLFERRLKLWCIITNADRSLSLILGLPYGVADAFFMPQAQLRLSSDIPAAEQYFLRLGIISGHMIDRNQNPSEMCLESTLRLDQELTDAWEAMPRSFTGLEPGPNENQESFHERIPLQFMPKIYRALLHLPFMLKYPHDPRFSFCHRTAIQSAREGLALYKVLRTITRSYLCKILDFLAFTMGMLLIVHLHSYSEDSPDHSKEQDDRDWELVRDVVTILRQAAAESGGSVAAESANILGAIFDTRTQQKDWTPPATCQVTVPYFGTITVGAGTNLLRPKSKDQNFGAPSPVAAAHPSKRTASQLFTPPMSDPEALSTNAETIDDTTGPDVLGSDFSTQPLIPGDEFGTSTLFTGLFDDLGQCMWPNPNIDLGLDHGWNLNWFE